MHHPSAPTPSVCRIAIHCLGGPSYVTAAGADGVPSPVFQSGRYTAILAYLVMQPDRSASREHLADLLWGDTDADDPRGALRRALSHIKAKLGADIFDDDREARSICRLSTAVQADALDFLSAFKSGEVQRAVELYTGPFLEQVGAPGCQAYETWADGQRAQLRHLCMLAADLAFRDAMDHGLFANARRLAARMQAVDPESELACRAGLEAVSASGSREATLAEAARFEEWLAAREFQPDAMSKGALNAARKLGNAVPPHPTSAALTADLVGREADFTTILDAWKRARNGSVEIILVSGAPGLGKTRLLNDVARRITAGRQKVVAVRAYPGEQEVPYAFARALAYEVGSQPGSAAANADSIPFALALEPRLAAVFPNQRPNERSGPDVLGDRATAIFELITGVAGERPFALMIDDAHWFDVQSRQVLAAALARLRTVPLLVVVAARPTGRALGVEDRAIVRTLMPLSTHDVEAMISSLGAIPADAPWADALVQGVMAASKGVPLYALAALDELMAQRVIGLRDGSWSCDAPEELQTRAGDVNALERQLRGLAGNALRGIVACAIVGRPIPRTLLAAQATESGHPLDQELPELERLGYLREMQSGIEVVHDVIAETALAVATDKLVTEVRRALGATLVRSEESQWVERGLRLLADEGQVDAMGPSLIRHVEKELPVGKSARVFVAYLLGRPIGDPVVQRATRMLPLRLKLRHRRTSLIAASVVVLVGGFATIAAPRVFRSPAPDALVEIVLDGGGLLKRSATIPIYGKEWTTTAPLTADFGRLAIDTVPRAPDGAAVEPGHDAWALEWRTPSSRELDLALVDRRGFVRLLTQSPKDNQTGSWSPDGRYIAIETGRFSPVAHPRIGILDLGSGVVRELDHGADVQIKVRWSPDGTRVAFRALDFVTQAAAVCVETIDAAQRRCMPTPGPAAYVLGWIDDSRILIWAPGGRVEELNAASGAITGSGIDTAQAADLSPDGRWLVYRTGRDDHPGEVFVAPATDLHHARQVVSSTPLPRALTIAWHGVAAPREYLDTVRIESPADTVQIGSRYRLTAAGTTNVGHVVPVRGPEWRSLNPEIATIDSSGSLTAVRTGVATVEASAGGWRRARRSLVVAAGSVQTVFTEDWSEPLDQRWTPFGTPLPRIVQDSALGRAFLNNGDGTYFSGAYLPIAFDARRGLALDVVLRINITEPQWQYTQVEIYGMRDLDVLRREWDHVNGYIPVRFIDPNRACGIAYPQGEGSVAKQHMSPVGRLPRGPQDSVPPLAVGVPTSIRIQIMPDGRCGIALNGRALRLAGSQPRLDSLFILLQGSSVHTRVLVGPLQVRSGVPGDVDWSKAPADRPPG